MPYGYSPSRLIPAGEWDSGTVYAAGQVITRNGSTYWAKTTPDVGNDPEVNSPDQWQLLARKGDTGEQGTQGDPGTPGATWHNGSGAPSGELGIDGDHYLDNDTGDTYQKVSGSWSSVGNIRGQQGQQGDPGTPGATWYSGSGSPGGELGIDGDYYLDTDNDDIHQKSSGSWSQIGSIRGQQGEPGEQGAAGATWHSCSGAPDNGLGGDGDHYLDTCAGDVYVKSGGSWSQTANIKGAQGDQGPPGSGSDVGDIKWVAHGNVPTGWMECNGQSVSASEYPDLFAKIGTTFGGYGDTFNLPDLQDRVVLSKSGGRSIGNCGGEETHCLSIDEMPCHDHGCCNACGTFDISGTICGVAGYDIGTCCVCASDPCLSVISCIWGCDGYPNTMPLCGTVSGSGSFSANWQTETRGSGWAHNNMQPYLVLMAVIKVAA